MTTPTIVAQPQLVVVESSDAASLVVSANQALVTSKSNSLTLVHSQRNAAVNIQRIDRQILAQGQQGPQGVPGTQATIQKTAAVAVGGHRAVILNSSDQVDYADVSVLAHRDVLFGITLGAVSVGALADVQVSGEITEPSWSWAPQQPIFLGLTGLLTQTPLIGSPALFRRIIAFAVDATRIVLDFREPVTF
jgi:hypothetical protein